MSKWTKIAIASLALYCVIGIVTFGHGAAGYERTRTAYCADREVKFTITCITDNSGMVGMGAAIFWPLYWSWEAWS